MIKGHIAAVEYLSEGSDEKMIEEAHGHFARRCEERASMASRYGTAPVASMAGPRVHPAEVRLTIFLPGTPSQARPKINTLQFPFNAWPCRGERMAGSFGKTAARLPPSGDWQSRDVMRRHGPPSCDDRSKSILLPK